jgi:Fur family peroxide stress response transcriptional regulator
MHRETRQREAVLKILRDTRSHPTADQIYDAVRREIPNISKGTVYRNLKVLKETGAVTELNLGGTLSRFEFTLGNHYHFRCGRCNRVVDVDEPVDAGLNKKVADSTGFQVDSHQLEFRGVCRECHKP